MRRKTGLLVTGRATQTEVPSAVALPAAWVGKLVVERCLEEPFTY